MVDRSVSDPATAVSSSEPRRYLNPTTTAILLPWSHHLGTGKNAFELLRAKHVLAGMKKYIHTETTRHDNQVLGNPKRSNSNKQQSHRSFPTFSVPPA
jgi:hypothetical protein